MFPIHLEFFGSTKYFVEGPYMILAILIGYKMAKYLCKKYEVSTDDFHHAIYAAFISGILGSKIFHEVFYEEHPSFLDMFKIWKGGMSITGAVILGPLFTYLFCRYKKINYWKIFALVVPAILLAQMVGRVGCFMNGDAHGVATNTAFGVQFPKYGYTIPSFEKDTSRKGLSPAWEYSLKNGLVSDNDKQSAALHPAQLYEAFADLLLCLILYQVLLMVFKKQLDFKLVPFGYVFGYSLIRFLLEFIKADAVKEPEALLTEMQWALLMISIVGIGMIVFTLLKQKKALEN